MTNYMIIGHLIVDVTMGVFFPQNGAEKPTFDSYPHLSHYKTWTPHIHGLGLLIGQL